MGFLSSICSSFDLFSKQFIFFIGRSKYKSTLIGGLISLIVLSVSFIYLYYLLNLYFQNRMEPKIAISTYVDDDLREMILEEEFLMFEMVIAGEPLNKIEKRTGKKYLQIYVMYDNWTQDGSNNSIKMQLVECQDKNFSGFLCLDSKQTKPLRLFPLKSETSNYGLYIQPCSGQPECVSQDEINDFILQSANCFTLAVKTMQYNKETRSINSSVFTEYFYFDQNLFLFSRMSFVIAEISIMEGAIIQSTNLSKTVYDYKRFDTSLTQEKIEQKFGTTGYGYIMFQLDQKRVFVSIQNPVVTEIIAQFMSVFNSLFIIGFIARLLSQVDIINDVINILLKDYFKQTAAKLIKNDEERKKQLEDQKKIKNNNKKNIKPQGQIKESKQQIFELNKKINEIDFIKTENQIFKTSFLSRIKTILKKIFRIQFKISQDQRYEYQVHEKILREALQRMNIYQLYTDLLRLKMAIKLIFSKQQYAAFLYCGSDLIFDNLNKCQEVNQQNITNKQNNQYVLNNTPNNKLQQTKIQQIDNISQQNDNMLSNINLLNKVSASNEEVTNQRSRQQQMQKEEETMILQKLKEQKSDQKESLLNSPSSTKMPLNFPPKIKFTNSLIKSDGDQELNQINYSQSDIISEINNENIIECSKSDKNNKQEYFTLNNIAHKDQFILKQEEDQNNDELESSKQLQMNHLFEMDQIEQDPEIREQYFKSFIDQIRKDKKQCSMIDLNLFNNLIKSDYLFSNNI